jgi:hypothetical protein
MTAYKRELLARLRVDLKFVAPMPQNRDLGHSQLWKSPHPEMWATRQCAPTPDRSQAYLLPNTVRIPSVIRSRYSDEKCFE